VTRPVIVEDEVDAAADDESETTPKDAA